MKGNVIRTAEDFVRATDPGLRVLYRIARQIYLDRNAAGITKKRGERAKIKDATQPLLRKALRHLRNARDAIFAGDATTYELEKRDALLWMARAATKRAEFTAKQEGQKRAKVAKLSPQGVEGRAAQRQEKSEGDELDALIRGCLNRGDPMRVKDWVKHFPLDRATIYRRIERARIEHLSKK